MRIAITGGTGMLGGALSKAFGKHSVSTFSARDLDVTSLPDVRREFSRLKPDWIVHAAAYTGVDAAETEVERAYRVNALGSRNVALAARENASRLLYYSTDFVFDGRQDRPYREWDPTGPLNEYGKSKLAGEFFVRSLCPAHLVIRTSWLFGRGGTNFVEKILKKAREKRILKVVSDQQGSPTFTTDLAYMTLCLVEGDKQGTYHVTNSQSCSWYELAEEIVSLASLDVQVQAISSRELPLPAPRPAYSVLENCMLTLEGIPLLRPWREALASFLGGVGNHA